MEEECKSIEALARTSERPILAFVGSGLCVPEPSSLPVSREVVSSLLNLDWVIGKEVFPLPKEKLTDMVQSIRFEQILSIFQDWLGHDLGTLLAQFAEARPNWYHLRLAELCRRRVVRAIITTNFDKCIERALEAVGVAYQAVVADVAEIPTNADTLTVFKIHGSIEHINNEYVARGMVATLASMYSGLPQWKAALLSDLLSRFCAAVLGYSGFDSFDINPVFREARSPQILWVAHACGSDLHVSSEVLDILSASRFDTPIHVDTAVFLGGQPLPRRQEQFKLKPTYDLNKGFHPSLFVGKVLEAVGDYENALEYYEMVRAESRLDYLPTAIYDLIRSIGVCLHEVGRPSEAHWELTIGKALVDRWASEVTSKGRPVEVVRVAVLDQALMFSEELAFVCSSLSEPESAKRHMDDAFELLGLMRSSYMREPWIKGRLLLNRALLTGLLPDHVPLADLLLAWEDAEEGVILKRELGDLQGVVDGRAVLAGLQLRLGLVSRAMAILHALLEDLRKLGTKPSPRLLVALGKRVAALSSTRDLPAAGRGKKQLFSRQIALARIQKIVIALQSGVLLKGGQVLEELFPNAELWRECLTMREKEEKGLEMEQAVRREVEQLGVGVRTARDKRESHLRAIRLVRRQAEGGGAKTAEVAEWEGLGDFYNQTGEPAVARLAYLAAKELVEQGIPDDCPSYILGLTGRLDRKLEELGPRCTEC